LERRVGGCDRTVYERVATHASYHEHEEGQDEAVPERPDECDREQRRQVAMWGLGVGHALNPWLRCIL
jgi:hypothetical protein